jgi:7-carboxy-7-deazaguanine synthase
MTLPADTLPVNEMFETIQGEGYYAGTPAIFIRLQGCPVGCPWCDTRYTWDFTPAQQIDPGEMMTKEPGQPTYAMLHALSIKKLCQSYMSRHIVITGGEPCLYDLVALTDCLLRDGRTVQIETSGTHAIRCMPATWVTVSPKFDMPGGYAVQPEAIQRANEIKMPVGSNRDIVKLFAMLDRHKPDVPIYLQPLSLSQRATQLCVETAIANNFRVSLQVHALAGWR